MLLLDYIQAAWIGARVGWQYRPDILWIDPINRDANFTNALAAALRDAGQSVLLRADIRRDFDPPVGVWLSSFSGLGRMPHSLEHRLILKAIIAALYPWNWIRAVRLAKRLECRTVLVSSSLMLPCQDIAGLKRLRAAGILPLVIVHKPYPNFFADQGRNAERYREWYELAERILVMTRYTQGLLQQLYGLPDSKFAMFPHPHFRNLLQPTEPLSV